MTGRRGNPQRGTEMMRQGILQFRSIRGYVGIASLLRQVFEEWGELEFELGWPERAATLLGASEQLLRQSKRLPSVQAEFDRRTAQVSAELGSPAFEEAWERGSGFTDDELLDFASAGPQPTEPGSVLAPEITTTNASSGSG